MAYSVKSSIKPYDRLACPDNSYERLSEHCLPGRVTWSDPPGRLTDLRMRGGGALCCGTPSVGSRREIVSLEAARGGDNTI